MGSGLVGALVYTFSDTFWFSAVEGEVYAFSSLFTAVVFWLILKWEDVADQPHSDRWLILIAYLTGLSIGVHLLNLLCLPAIVLVYYYKKTPNATAKGSLLALIGSGVLVAAVLYGIVPGIVKVGGWFELMFVNGMGMPFNTGVVVYIIILAASLIWGIYESYTEKQTTYGYLLYPHHCPVGYSVLRTWSQQHPNWYFSDCRIDYLPCSTGTEKDKREMAYFRTYHEYNFVVYHDDCNRIFVLCTDRNPFHSQYSDGSELPGRHLHFR